MVKMKALFEFRKFEVRLQHVKKKITIGIFCIINDAALQARIM